MQSGEQSTRKDFSILRSPLTLTRSRSLTRLKSSHLTNFLNKEETNNGKTYRSFYAERQHD